MPILTSLTLEFIRLDDDNLNKVNVCFPCLQKLNLIGVGGLKEPKIHLFQLRTCLWTVSNAPQSLVIFAPNLVKLKLKCVKPRSLILETPLLSDFCLSLEETKIFEVKELLNLKNLQLQSTNLYNLVHSFPSGIPTKSLTVGSLKCSGPGLVEITALCHEELFDVFTNVSFLTLQSGAWSQMETCFLTSGLQSCVGMKDLKEITAQLVLQDIDVTLLFIFGILDSCTNLSNITLLIHHEVDPNVASILISRCKVMASRPRVKWKWECGRKTQKKIEFLMASTRLF